MIGSDYVADVLHSPSFLKKITEMPMPTLSLPTLFVSKHGKLIGSDVILEGPGQKQWKVTVEGSFPSSNLTFGQGWEAFVNDQVLQLGDQLSFFLVANSLFEVQVYDENGCQKTSALDAIDSNALSSLSGKLLDSQIPLDTASRPVDAAVKTGNSTTSPQLSRRESALESIRRDSARSGSQVREPYVLPKDGASSIKIPDFLLDVAECLEGLKDILLEPPDLTDTAPFNEADFPPCWEEWELHDNTDPKRVSTLFADRPPDLQMSQSLEIKDPDPPKRTSMRPPALEIPPVTEPDTPIELGSPLIPDPSSTRPGGATGRMSQIDDPALQLEKLLLYTKTAAEAALVDLKMNSEANSPSSRRESALNFPSSRRESALNFDM